MILAIDIGNSNIVIGLAEGERILFRERVATDHAATALQYAAMLRTAFEMNGRSAADVSGAIVSSVVPGVTAAVAGAVQKFAHKDPILVGPGIKTGLKILIDNPAQLGSDLVVDAVAGLRHYPLPLILIDMGTATTLSVLGKDGSYLGGMICPGMAVASNALVGGTSQLPRIAFEVPKTVIGRNTVDCMKSGLLYGSAGALDGLIDRIEAEIGARCTVVATGGLAGTVVPLCRREILLDDDLLLKGLLILYEKNAAPV